MGRLQQYRWLRQNVKLSQKRNPALEQNTVAKVLMWVGGLLMAAYLIVLGSMMGKLAAETDEPAWMLVVMPVMLVLDFVMRFALQQTPAVFLKPYLLTPMRRQTVMESYLLSMAMSSYNLLWLAMLLPYAIVAVAGSQSFWVVLLTVVAGELMMVANSQWYLLVRALLWRSVLWWLLPVAFYALLLLPLILAGFTTAVIEYLLYAGSTLPGAALAVLLAAVLLTGLLWLNRRVQLRSAMAELTREQKKPAAMKHVWQLNFLERFGQPGEYLKLELKSIMRNKAIRSRVVMSLVLIAMLSGLIAYTDVYDNVMLLNFWCYYCFSIYGMTTLAKVMAPEGNYIDLLMTQHEHILMLLKAKYYFHVAILLVPLVIMLPAVISGKFTIMMMLAYLLLTSGLSYSILFQLAVYNKQTLPLDQKITGKNNVESGLQLLIEMVGMFLPLLLVSVILMVASDTVAYTVMALLGLALTLAHPWWLRHIYTRMMRRKYTNMEGFHATR